MFIIVYQTDGLGLHLAVVTNLNGRTKFFKTFNSAQSFAHENMAWDYRVVTWDKR